MLSLFMEGLRPGFPVKVEFLLGGNQFRHKPLFVQDVFSDSGQGHTRGEKRGETHECFPIDEIGPGIGMVGKSVGYIPADSGAYRHGDTLAAASVPCRNGYGNEVENEKTEFVSGNIIQPTKDKQDGGASQHDNGPMTLKDQRVRIVPPFYEMMCFFHMFSVMCASLAMPAVKALREMILS